MQHFIDFLGGKEKIENTFPILKDGKIHFLRNFLPSQLQGEASITDEDFINVYEKNPDWVQQQKKRFFSKDETEMFGALGELHAYADLLHSGFDVIANGTNPGCDFIINRRTENINIEVASKTVPSENTHIVSENKGTKISETAYFGFPKEDKFSIECSIENMISKIASMKKDEHQVDDDAACVLYLDFRSFLFNESLAECCLPITSHQGALCLGGIWLACYGEKDQVLIDSLRVGEYPHKRLLRHNGRFYSKNTSKFCGFLCSFSSYSNGLVFLQNPNKQIPDWFLTHLACNRRFSIQYSCMGADNVQLQNYILIQNRRIDEALAIYDINKY